LTLSEHESDDRIDRAATGRRASRARIRVAAIAFLAIAVGLAVDAFWIEPYRIEVSQYYVAAPLAAPLKIAEVADLHSRSFGRRERDTLAILDREKPDLIVIVGDSISDYGYDPLRELLPRLHAPLGVWLVRGNWEVAWPMRGERAFYESLGVHLLVNESARVREDVWLVGLDDPVWGSPKLDEALAGVPAGAYTVALFHAPEFFDRAAGRCNLALSGHTHGGQFRVPLLPPVWLPPGSGRFVEGWYEEKGTRMYVSRGIGTSLVDARFLCRPEIALFTVGPSGP
jgi:predicted MPP superfamily phosphohydrolase